MRLKLWVYILAASAAAMSGCAASQPSTTGQPGMPPLRAAGAHATPARSWMLPNAKKNSLLYVADFYGSEVLAYTFPGGQLAGTITGINSAQGMCTSKKSHGNWWVVATGSNQVFEFAHGGTTPIATINISAGVPASCAVDAKTGNLAVTMIGNENVVVYAGGSGSGTTYTAPFQPFFSSYDSKGNLFVDGSGQTPLAELPKGGSAFIPISTNQTIIFSGGVQWDGRYLAVGDQDTSDVYRFSVSGSSATLVSTTALNGGSAGGFWIQKKRLITSESGDVDVWKYPAGGSPIKQIAGGFYGPLNMTVSTAK
ncbi:MAG TPA: hypothetical protein VHR97_12630 [Candidatus Baltobacteraceae bacterium]|jgi:hypothetical protein|nr:hypothetical protein [Candidatus Baltobacteraceae bacterium]